MLARGAVDVLQADATRCAGITGFIRAAELCRAFGVPLSAHTAPSLHAPLGCALTPVVHVEYFFDHARLEEMLFDGALRPVDGRLEPDLTRPGFGLEFRSETAAKYAA
jgi:L-alanine-DL-glutamate epimerase-like enolase superfamily enzyme